MFISSVKHAVSRSHSSSFSRLVCSWNVVQRKLYPVLIVSGNLRQCRQITSKCVQLEPEYAKKLNTLNAAYPEFKEMMMDKIPLVEAKERLGQILDYNIYREDNSHVLLFLKLSEDLSNESKKQNYSRAQIHTIGWILETFTMLGILIDDMADNSQFRFGKPCWHRLENNAKIVQNDLYMLNSVTHSVFWQKFRKYLNYDQIFALINKLNIDASSAELLDYLTKNTEENLNLDEYYKILAESKGTFGFGMQIKTALYMNGYEQITFNHTLEKVCKNLGYYHSLLNDYFDIKGHPYETGKKYENIKEGDITWFFKEAVKIVPHKRLKILKEYYGSNKEESVEKVLQIYEEANLMEKFERHEAEVRKILTEDINKLPIAALQSNLQHLVHGFEKIKSKDVDLKQAFVWILF